VRAFLIADLVIGAVGLLVVVFVAFPYRGRAVPRAERLSHKVADVAGRLDPGPAPVHGVLSTPEKSRRMARRFERVERAIKRPGRALVSAGRSQS
jgi:hypothetical protein